MSRPERFTFDLARGWDEIDGIIMSRGGSSEHEASLRVISSHTNIEDGSDLEVEGAFAFHLEDFVGRHFRGEPAETQALVIALAIALVIAFVIALAIA